MVASGFTAKATRKNSSRLAVASSQLQQQQRTFHTSPTQLMNSYNSNNENQGFLSKLKNTAKGVAKSVLPKKWFQSEEEQRAEIERKRMKEEVTGGLNQVFKDAPFPVRMLGSMITPLISSAMSTMAETMQQQQASMQQVLSQANRYILNDVAVQQTFGSAVQVSSSPFSQSSSSTSINGQTSTRIELGVAVQGSNGLTGVAQITANEQGVQRIVVQPNNGGRSISVSLTDGGGGGRFSRASDDDDNVIEAEIVDKKVDKW